MKNTRFSVDVFIIGHHTQTHTNIQESARTLQWLYQEEHRHKYLSKDGLAANVPETHHKPLTRRRSGSDRLDNGHLKQTIQATGKLVTLQLKTPCHRVGGAQATVLPP